MPTFKSLATKLLVIVGIVLLLYFALAIPTLIQRWRLDRMEAAITRVTYPGQTCPSYRDALRKLGFFYYISDWEEGEPRGSGRSIPAVTHHVKGVFDVDILVTGEFDKHQQLLGLTMRRRMHGF